MIARALLKCTAISAVAWVCPVAFAEPVIDYPRLGIVPDVPGSPSGAVHVVSGGAGADAASGLSEVSECPGNSYWQSELKMCIVKPPTPAQAECIAAADKGDDLVNAIDLGTTAVALGLGATEIGLAGVAGPAAPIALVVLKLISRDSKKQALKHAYSQGEYDRACGMLKARNGITEAAVASTLVMGF